jgi:hypothetical protein
MWTWNDTHAWVGTQHCLRAKDGDGFQCCNDHTGCLWNDGHNECGHPSKSFKVYDSPLSKGEHVCLWCKTIGYGYHKIGPEYLCQGCWSSGKMKYA